MLKQLIERLRNAETEEELMAILQDSAAAPIAHSRLVDMMTMEQLQTVSQALLASAKEQFGADFVRFIVSYVPVSIALQRAIAKTDMSVPNEVVRRHMMELFD